MRSWWVRRPRTASAWFARLRFDSVTPEADARFRHWLASDPRNEQRYECQELTWELSSDLQHDEEIEALVQEAERAAPPARWIGALLELRARPAFAVLVCCAFVIALGALVFRLFGDDRERLYATGVAEERTIVLPDHSEITLNTATRLRVAYRKSVRAVTIEQGEATFTVAHDTAHPFVVSAAGGTARALRTQFNVLANGGDITVSVLEGKVAVAAMRQGGAENSTPPSATVTAGEEVRYGGGRLTQVRPANIARIQGWHARRVVFDDMTVSNAIADFNRYSQVPLRLGDDSLAAKRVTGVFRVGETDALLNALDEAFGVKVERTNGSIILRSKNQDK